jgi:predicted Zn-dependent protease
MNIEKIKQTLKNTDGIYGWLIYKQTVQGTSVLHTPNLYTVENGKFIRTGNPYPREVISLPSEEIRITVYARSGANQNEFMGEASDQILSDDESVLKTQVASLVKACQSQKNRLYSLPDKSAVYKTDISLADPKIAKSDKTQLLNEISRFSKEILDATAEQESVDLSNIEIFIKNYHNSLDTSTGINVVFDSTRADIELCFIARLNDDRVAEATARLSARRLEDLNPRELVKDYAGYARSIALSRSPIQYQGPVIVIGEALANMFDIDNNVLSFHANASSVYNKISRYEPGKPITDDAEIKGERVTIISNPHIPYGPSSQVFSQVDASPSRIVTLVKDGNYNELIGSRRYYEYLGLLEKGLMPSGPLGNTFIPAGKTKQVDLLSADKIVAIKLFSSWTTNPTNGDFACEIRLGEIRENGKITPFKGGMLIGNYFKMFAQAKLSHETVQINNYYGPAAVRFENLQVAG